MRRYSTKIGGYVDLTPEEEAQRVQDEADAAVAQAKAEAEQDRLDTFKQVSDREAFVIELTTRTATEVESFVRSRVDADSVTDVASAKACMKRIETGMVRLLQLMAYVIKE